MLVFHKLTLGKSGQASQGNAPLTLPCIDNYGTIIDALTKKEQKTKNCRAIELENKMRAA
ncbi:hypothetical protein Z948_2541 [Sulfitobacter donghicola DSW-25 = KCTC 12864 = JCM 14565]|nr:hypothetical protein Z948_2541 [Sulfitobacter donghicola DSW-25 = KCTC 12864 = JCM 14565]